MMKEKDWWEGKGRYPKKFRLTLGPGKQQVHWAQFQFFSEQPENFVQKSVGPNCELKTLGLLKSKNILKDFEGQRNLKAKDFWLQKNFMFKRDLSPEKFVSLIS